MDTRGYILEVEARANAARLKISELCRKAEIARATWWRWKQNRGSPTLTVWDRVIQVIIEHEGSSQ